MAKKVSLERYEKLKRQLEEAKQKQARAEGARDELLKKLREEWGCESLEEAEAKLAELEEEAEASSAQFEKALDEFEKKWDELG